MSAETLFTLQPTSQYRKDRKRLKKQGFPMELLDDVLQTLIEGKQLAPVHNDHMLSGNYAGHRECHVKPDWLLIYIKNQEKLILTATRTGSHSDLFR